MSLYSKNYGGQNTVVSKSKLLTDKIYKKNDYKDHQRL